MTTPQEILQKYWGYNQFRALQLEIIQAALLGKDTLALLPTGGGKSICFQVPALCQLGICIVISPLIALMKDQVYNLKKRGIPAVAIYSGMSSYEIDIILDKCVAGEYKFLYLSPERLCTEIAQVRISQMTVNFFAVDEAHCISQWGYDFRPAYLQIAEIRNLHPETPIIALTATATAPVVEDIQERLAFKKENKAIFQKSFARPNLSYVVFDESNKRIKMLDILKKVQGSGVVYVQNRKETKEIATYLQQHDISANFYHAGLNVEQRSKIQEDWIKDKIRIIVATNAFGMGIDKPNVRIVIHLTLPESLEAYFQEAGRAGRDEQKAYAVLLYNESDKQKLETQYKLSFPELQEVRNVYKALGSYYQLAIGSAQGLSFDFDIMTFCKRYEQDPILALNALKILMQEGYIDLSEQIFQPSTLQILASREALYDYALRNPKMEKLLKAIMRAYQGVNQQEVNIREAHLAQSLSYSMHDLVLHLQLLHKENIVKYKAQKDNPQLTFLTERLHEKDVVFNKARYDFLRTRYLERMNAALNYATVLRCRSQQLLNYFNELDTPICGKCDVCTGRHDKNKINTPFIKNIEENIKLLLHKFDALTLHEIVNSFPSNQHLQVSTIIDFLLDNNILRERNDKKIIYNEKF